MYLIAFYYVGLAARSIAPLVLILGIWLPALQELLPADRTTSVTGGVALTIPFLCLLSFVIGEVRKALLQGGMSVREHLRGLSSDAFRFVKIGAGGIVWIGGCYFAAIEGNWLLGGLLGLAALATMLTKD